MHIQFNFSIASVSSRKLMYGHDGSSQIDTNFVSTWSFAENCSFSACTSSIHSASQLNSAALTYIIILLVSIYPNYILCLAYVCINVQCLLYVYLVPCCLFFIYHDFIPSVCFITSVLYFTLLHIRRNFLTAALLCCVPSFFRLVKLILIMYV